jgi:hypothetical protein
VHPDGEVADAGPGVEPGAERPERAVVGGHGARRESECWHEESATLIDHWPPTGRKPTGSGRGCPVRPASVKHCTISSRSPGAVYLNVI